MNYYLFLDESGNFKEEGLNYKSSIVAGYLFKGDEPKEEWARKYLKDIKGRKSIYSSINTNNFHAMEEKNVHLTGFVVDLLSKLVKDKIELVNFRNRKGTRIVDSNTTYLNVFVEGVMTLLRHILATTDKKEEISLKIIYAHRQDDIMREEHSIRIRIMEDEYRKRIDERLSLLIAKMPSYHRRLIKNIKLETDSAEKNPLLMISDAICFAFRGGNSRFKGEERELLNGLPAQKYIVPEQENWNTIHDNFLQDHYAEGIFLWYGGMCNELETYKDEFKKSIISYFSDASPDEYKIATMILSQYLRDLVHKRRFTVVDNVIEGLDKEFIPWIKEMNKYDVSDFMFDIHYYRLTTATHEGDYKKEEEEMEICREILKNKPNSFDTLNTYLRYKIREVEHYKNTYDFKLAWEELEKLKGILNNLMSLISMIDELGTKKDNMKSGTLGRIYGSSITTRSYLGLVDSDEFNKAREDYVKACYHFDNPKDIMREDQYLAQVEYMSGNYEKAYKALIKALCLDASSTPEKVMTAIMNDNTHSKDFLLMHYATLMSYAIQDGVDLGYEMAKAFDKTEKKMDSNYVYPNYITLWRMATVGALTKKKAAREWYQKAIEASMKKKNECISMFTGIVIQIDRLLYLNSIREKELNKLKDDYKEFMTSNVSSAMKKYLLRFEIEKFTAAYIENNKNNLQLLVRKTPIL